MTTLPNLDPDTAGQCAFYNLIEQGGLTESSLTLSEMVDNPNVNSYETYDNGVILAYDDSGVFGNIIIRCKTDGWVVAYTGWDGSEPSGLGGGGPSLLQIDYPGDDITKHPDISSIDNNRLVQAMKDVMDDLSDWNLVSFSPSDVGLYDFTFGSDAVSIFDERVLTDNGNDGNTKTKNRTITEAGATNLHSAQIWGYIYLKSSSLHEGLVRIKAAGETKVRDTYNKNMSDDYPDKDTIDVTTAVDTNGSISVELFSEQGQYRQVAHTLAALYWSEA